MGGDQHSGSSARPLDDESLVTMGRIATEMVHDLSNQCQALLLTLQLARQARLEERGTDAADQHEVDEHLRNASDVANRLAEGLADVKTFMRRERRPVEFDLEAVVHRACRVMHPLVSQHGALHVHLAPVRTRVGFPGEIANMVVNLLLNSAQALQHTKHAEPCVTVTLRAAPEQAVLSVEDTGVGIAPELLPNIFDRFMTTKPRGKGSGLGLARVKDIATRHGGGVTIASEVDGFTRVEVTIANETGLVLEHPSAPRGS